MQSPYLPRDRKAAVDSCRILLCVFLLAAGVLRGQLPAQVPPPATGRVQAKLLEGTPRFDLALSLQGDLRGNYGPCG